jgi:hypothetical protein
MSSIFFNDPVAPPSQTYSIVILIAYISANIGATNKLPSIGLLHFGQKRGFGPHQDVIDILLIILICIEESWSGAPFGVRGHGWGH